MPEGQSALDDARDALDVEHAWDATYRDLHGVTHSVKVRYSENYIASSPLEQGIENSRPVVFLTLGKGLNPQRGEGLTLNGISYEIIEVEFRASRQVATLYISTL